MEGNKGWELKKTKGKLIEKAEFDQILDENKASYNPSKSKTFLTKNNDSCSFGAILGPNLILPEDNRSHDYIVSFAAGSDLLYFCVKNENTKKFELFKIFNFGAVLSRDLTL